MNRQESLIPTVCRAGKLVVNFLSTMAMLFLFVHAMGSSFSHWHGEWNEYTELLLPRMQDSLVWNVAILLLMLSFLLVFFYFWDKFGQKERQFPLVGYLMAAAMFFLSVLLVVNLDAIPRYDMAAVIGCAKDALKGDWSSFEPDGYMTRYPQQIGLFSVLYFLMKFTQGKWWYYQGLNCLALAGILLVGGALSRRLWERPDDQQNAHTGSAYIYMLLQFFCVPAYLYTCFIYGEIVSTFLCICAIYMVVEAAEQGTRVYRLALIALLMSGAVWIRKNLLIAMIALTLCMLWKAMAERQKCYVKIALALLLSLGIYQMAGSLIFGSHIKHYDSIPTAAWIAMGMEKNTLGYGAWNNFSDETFEATGFSAELTKQEAYQKIRQLSKYYLNNPKEAVVFLKEKILWQWTDPDYESMYSTSRFENEGFLKRVYYGDLRRPIWNLLNWYQNLVYFGLLIAFLCEWKKKNNGLQMIFQVIFLGYFFFSILWEAKPRYMVMCFIMMLPLAAYGLGQFSRESGKLAKKLLSASAR